MPTNFPLNGGTLDRRELIPALIGAGVCLFFSRMGFLALFYLLPLGFVALKYGYKAAWSALFLAVIGNIVVTAGNAAAQGLALTGILWNILYFAVMACIFTWIAAPPLSLPSKICGTIRLVIGASLASLFLVGMFFRFLAAPGFLEQVTAIANAVIAQRAAPGADVVQAALLAEITPEMVMSFMRGTILRGGALISSALLFFVSRQISFFLARLFTRNRPEANQQTASPLLVFHVHPAVIWVLSGALLLVVLSSMASLEIPQIVLWNILILCGMLYLAQGTGILLFFLARPAVTPLLRLLLCVLFLVLVLSPGINAVLLGGVVLLGVAENWVPFRSPKSNRPPSTPEAGDFGN